MDLLQAVVFEGQEEVQKVLAAGTNPNFQDAGGWTALMMAAQMSDEEVIETLLNGKADPNIQSNSGTTALIQASYRGCAKIVRALLKFKADPNIRDRHGYTALMLASNDGYENIVKLLLDKEADPNVQSENGENSLIIVLVGYEGSLTRLSDYEDDRDEEMLEIINSIERYKRIVKLLLKYGADPTLENNEKRDTYDYVGDKAKELMFEYQPLPDRFMENAVTSTIYC